MPDIKCNLFPGGRPKALTLSYDDGREHDRRLVDTLNRYGLRAAFHLNSGFFDRDGYVRADEILSLYQGHEVACHTVNHPRLPLASLDQVVAEITQNRRDLESLVQYPVRGFSYPCGGHNHDYRVSSLLPSLGIAYGRTLHNEREFRIPHDLCRWMSTCHHGDDLMGWAEKFLAIKQPDNEGRLLFVWGHSYEFERDGNWDLIDTFGTRVSGRDDIWYATPIEVADYLAASQRLVFDVALSRVCNPSACSVWLSVNGEQIEVRGGETGVL
jgi:peptidoglycan-N-acetylglucosamine deacetylase